MSREIQIVWAGRHDGGPWDALCADYRRRIGRFLPIHERVVRAPSAKNAKARLLREGRLLIDAIPDRAWVIALDRGGRQFSSRQWSEHLTHLREAWPHSVVFVIGSDLGLGDGVLKAARERLSLGRMTLPHNLARVVLLEQIYRALSIGAGIKYHREPL